MEILQAFLDILKSRNGELSIFAVAGILGLVWFITKAIPKLFTKFTVYWNSFVLKIDGKADKRTVIRIIEYLEDTQVSLETLVTALDNFEERQKELEEKQSQFEIDQEAYKRDRNEIDRALKNITKLLRLLNQKLVIFGDDKDSMEE